MIGGELLAVSNCRFCYYSDTVRPKDQETIAIGETACYSQFPRGRACHIMQGPYREALELVRRQKERGENVGKRLYCGFCGKKRVRQGKQAM